MTVIAITASIIWSVCVVFEIVQSSTPVTDVSFHVTLDVLVGYLVYSVMSFCSTRMPVSLSKYKSLVPL